MFIQILILIAGLLFILVGANFLVEGSSNVARKFGISEFLIGLTIVGIGTSTPEMVVSFFSAIQGRSDMAVGNVIGSNIFNTLFILGITAIITPLTITRTNIRRDIPMNIFATVLLILLGMNQTIFGIGHNAISRGDGLIFLAVFAYYIYISFKNDKNEVSEVEIHENEKQHSNFILALMILGGLAGLIYGGSLFVSSASKIAKIFGVSDAFIAITIMAGGTSLPELATCIVAAYKGKGDLALGNALGSNISNILLILGGSALINPLFLKGITPIDLGMVLLCSIVILASAYLFLKNKLDKTEGIILLFIQASYMAWLIFNI